MNNQIMNHNTDTVYTVGFICLLLRLLLHYSNLFFIPELLSSLLLALFVVCMLWVLINRPMKETEFIVIAVAGAICVYSYVKMHNYYVISTYLCMAASKEIDLKAVLKWSYQIKAFLLILHIIVYIIIYLTNPNSIEYVYRLDGSIRHSFLLSHSNTFSMFLMWTFFEYIYVNYDKIGKKSIGLIFVLDMCLNYFADSNTNMILITMVLVFVSLNKMNPNKELKVLYLFAKFGYALMGILFCSITVAYQYLSGELLELYLRFNEFLTGRLIHGAYVYSKYGFTLFGKNLYLPLKDYWQGYWFNGIACDNSYIWYMVSFGTFFMMVIAVLFFVTSRRFTDVEIIMACAYILYSITENYVTNAIFCFPLIFIAQYAFNLDWGGEKRFKIVWT